MKVKTLHEIHDEGMDALRKTLGPVDMVRFIQMFDPGKGDYTKERKQWLSNDLDEICNEIYEMQKRAKTVSSSE
ncbi:MAG: hypothetical protein EHM53_12050 [Methanoregulaceae archaeon]|nr:MAG: hypothetical protein EHM53_12050 [Methanoregulaceae archaeon]